MEAGVSTYLVGNIDPAKVQPVIEAAMAQFKHFQELRVALAETKSELKSRRQIERAKYALMQCLSVTEEEAYRKLQTTAMNSGQPLAVVAERVLAKIEKSGG